MKRSNLQNRSLHKYLEWVAGAMADAGYDLRKVVKLPIKPTKENVKEEMFKPVMSSLFPDIEKTSDLSTKQMQDAYEVFNAAISQKLGIGFDWPSNESLMEQSNDRTTTN